MSSAAIERGVMWVCYPCDILLSEKVSPLLCFQNSKVWISALEEDRKAMAFDLKGWLLLLEDLRPEINGLMPFTNDLLLSVRKSMEWFIKSCAYMSHGQTNKVNVVISMYT